MRASAAKSGKAGASHVPTEAQLRARAAVAAALPGSKSDSEAAKKARNEAQKKASLTRAGKKSLNECWVGTHNQKNIPSGASFSAPAAPGTLAALGVDIPKRLPKKAPSLAPIRESSELAAEWAGASCAIPVDGDSAVSIPSPTAPPCGGSDVEALAKKRDISYACSSPPSRPPEVRGDSLLQKYGSTRSSPLSAPSSFAVVGFGIQPKTASIPPRGETCEPEQKEGDCAEKSAGATEVVSKSCISTSPHKTLEEVVGGMNSLDDSEDDGDSSSASSGSSSPATSPAARQSIRRVELEVTPEYPTE